MAKGDTFVEDAELRVSMPGWEHIRFRYCSPEEWQAAHPCHRFTRTGDDPRYRYIVSEACSLCPDHKVPDG
jgi:hypothetical protein